MRVVIRCAGAAFCAPPVSGTCPSAALAGILRVGGELVKLSERHAMVPDEQTAGPATAVAAPPTRTAESNSVMQRLVSRHPAGLHAFAGGNRAVGALITQPKLTVSQPHDGY